MWSSPPRESELEQLAQSLVIFGRASGQIAYAVELHDAFAQAPAPPQYHGGLYGHPYSKIAEDKIVLELTYCLDEYERYYAPLVGGDQPVEARGFFEALAAESSSLRTLRMQVMQPPAGDAQARAAALPQFLQTLPGATGYWRGRGREALVVFDAMWRYHARAPWFPEVRARAIAWSVPQTWGSEAPHRN